MKKNILFVIFVLIFFISCFQTEEQKAYDSAMEVIKKNIKANELKDIDMIFSTLITKADKPEVRMMIKAVHEKLNVKIRIVSSKLLKYDKVNKIIEIEVENEAKRIDGVEFVDNRSIIVHTLVLEDNSWKIAKSIKIKTIKI